jgi:hypothetical protein
MLRRLAKLTIETFVFDDESLRKFEGWGWVSLHNLKNAIAQEQYNRGISPIPDYGVFFQTFFPHPAHFVNKKPRVFDWIIVREDGSAQIESGDIMFCPFPTVIDHCVCRTQLGPKDQLYVPAGWANEVLKFASDGFIGLQVQKNDRPTPDTLPFDYYVMGVDGGLTLSANWTGLRFCKDEVIDV